MPAPMRRGSTTKAPPKDREPKKPPKAVQEARTPRERPQAGPVAEILRRYREEEDEVMEMMYGPAWRERDDIGE